MFSPDTKLPFVDVIGAFNEQSIDLSSNVDTRTVLSMVYMYLWLTTALRVIGVLCLRIVTLYSMAVQINEVLHKVILTQKGKWDSRFFDNFFTRHTRVKTRAYFDQNGLFSPCTCVCRFGLECPIIIFSIP